ncbi:alpha-sarcoglycan [Rhynochetos jubatus]
MSAPGPRSASPAARSPPPGSPAHGEGVMLPGKGPPAQPAAGEGAAGGGGGRTVAGPGAPIAPGTCTHAPHPTPVPPHFVPTPPYPPRFPLPLPPPPATPTPTPPQGLAPDSPRPPRFVLRPPPRARTHVCTRILPVLLVHTRVHTHPPVRHTSVHTRVRSSSAGRLPAMPAGGCVSTVPTCPPTPLCPIVPICAPLVPPLPATPPPPLHAWPQLWPWGGSRAAPPDHRRLPDHHISAETGTVFVHELEQELFREAFAGGPEDESAAPPITFRAHLRDHPDLPRWLRYVQRDPRQPGYLYGCPAAPQLGTHTVQVLAYNRHTYATAAQRLVVTVIPAPGGDPPFQGEFLVGNRDVEELLPAAARDAFLRAAAGVWDRGDLRVTNVTSALDRGGRVPLPIEGRKEGVYVTVGSHGGFSGCLAAAASPQNRFRCGLGQQPLAPCYDTFAPRFSIRWCNLTLLQVWPSPPAPGPTWGTGVLEEDGGFQPPAETPAPRDLLPGFLVTLLVPLAVAALLCLLLGHLMCCRREGVQKRDSATSDIQLLHHTTIHGDTEELRHMAGSRDVPRPLSTLPMFNVRTGQRINPMPTPPDGARAPLLPQ